MNASKKTRKYEETHPWITFRVNTNEFDHVIWLLLGEAKSKCDHIVGSPLLPQVKDMLMNVFLVKGAQATTAIEGNTLSEEEVKKRIEGDLELPPSKEYLGQEIDNVVDVYNLIGSKMLDGDTAELSVEDIEEYNRLVLKDLPLEEDVNPGVIRDYSVGVANYRGAPPEDCKYLLQKLVDWLNNEFNPPDEQERIYGMLKAIVAHLYFEWIHPFWDGNGRTGRLIEFQILLSVGVPATAAHLLSNHYNQTRSEYYRHLEMASQSNGNIVPFVKYALQGFVDQLKIQITIIRSQQLQTHWINHVHESFRNKEREEDKRRKRLILDLSEQPLEKRVPISDIRHITPRIAELYAPLGDRTIQRDVERLRGLDLVNITEEGIRPNWELLQAFMSPKRGKE